MEFIFTSDRSCQKADEISEYLVGPRLWIPQTDYPDFSTWVQRVHSQIKSESKRAMVALYGGNIVGAVIYQKHRQLLDALEIKNITVRPDMQGRHIATFLLRQAEIEGKHDFRTRRVVADAKANNIAIRAYLFRNGYLPIAKVDLYGLKSGDDILYGKKS